MVTSIPQTGRIIMIMIHVYRNHGQLVCRTDVNMHWRWWSVFLWTVLGNQISFPDISCTLSLFYSIQVESFVKIQYSAPFRGRNRCWSAFCTSFVKHFLSSLEYETQGYGRSGDLWIYLKIQPGGVPEIHLRRKIGQDRKFCLWVLCYSFGWMCLILLYWVCSIVLLCSF